MVSIHGGSPVSLPDLEAWAIFAKVAETGSFAAAAAELGLSGPTVSKAVQRLEARLGERLIHRTSRRFALTESGRVLAVRAARILAEGEAAEAEAHTKSAVPRGRVRLAAPMSFGVAHLAPVLPDFLARYPEVDLDLNLSDAQVDLVAEGYDVALRIAVLADSSLRARRLCAVRRPLVASPAYLKARGTPKVPADLASHDCIFGPGNFGRDSWSFRRNGTETSVDVRGRIHTNSGPGAFASVMAGLGIAMASTVMCEAEIEAGLLVPLLLPYKIEPVDVHAVFPGGPRPSTKVRALVDFLARELK